MLTRAACFAAAVATVMSSAVSPAGGTWHRHEGVQPYL